MRSASVFEGELGRETLLSERLRARILGAVACVLALGPLLGLFFPGQVSAFLPTSTVWQLESVIVVFALYELAFMNTITSIALKRGYHPHPVVRYLNALAETSVPSVALLVAAPADHPLAVLASPGPLAYFLFILLAALRLDPRLCVFTGIVAGAEYVALWAGFTLRHPDPAIVPFLASPLINIAKGLLMLMAGVAAAFVTMRVRRAITQSLTLLEERNDVLAVFGQHVSPAVVAALMAQESGAEQTQTRAVCVMFLDIRDFTTFSEHRTPPEVVAHLNALFDFMIEIVNRNGGIINKFLGDGFMAVFGAPISHGNDARNAVVAARELLARVREECAAGTLAQTRIGIGLHQGDAVTGTVGSKERREYTIIGDTVNLASRIESLNKQYGTQILLSEAVHSSLDGEFETIDVGEATVKGRTAPVRIYSLA